MGRVGTWHGGNRRDLAFVDRKVAVVPGTYLSAVEAAHEGERKP